MKKRLHYRKRLLQLALSLCLILMSNYSSWGQQVIGSFPYMDGGFEAQTTGTLGSVVTAGSWIRLNATNGASTINTTGARTGAKYANATYTLNTGNNRILQTPNSTSTTSTDWPTAASHTVQFWIKNSTGASIPVGVGSTGGNYVSPAITSGSGTWLMYTQAVTAVSASQAASYAAVRIQNATANFDIDDFVVYLGAADSTPPAAATAAATPVNGTTVSWTAASGGVDGGGYMVVRYATNPNINQDPNQNGIYAKGLAITNGTNGVSNPGTVVYIGTGTSFTDDVAGSSSGTDYYKIYTVDKAFNYAAELIATAVVSSTPAITSSTETLTGFNYTGAGPSASQSFVVSGSNLTANLVVSTASTDFELSSDNFSTAGASSISLSGITVASTILYVRLKASLTGGVKTATVTIASTGANTLNSISLSGSVQAVYYYNGSGLLSSNISWGANSDGTGANPTDVTATYTHFVIANGNATTAAAWILGSNSKVIVGNGSAVTLTVANTFPITGTIDAAASGSIVWQHVATSPTFGTLDNASEVHLQPATAASYSFGATTAYGKLFVDGLGEVSVSSTASTPTVKTALTVASGSTLSFTSSNNPTISVNAAATATVNGTVKTSKATGLFASTGSIPLIGAATLVLGTSSTIEFSRSPQTVTTLPTGVNYANLILSDGVSTAAAAKTIASSITVNGALTINLATPAFSTISAASNITLANGATIVMTSGVLDGAPAFGATVNVTYNGRAAQIAGAEIPSSGLNILTINNTVSVTFNNLTIEPGASANVLKGSLIVTGNLTNNGSLTIENKSNLVQPTNASTFVQNPSASTIVKRSSSFLFRSDYTLWSSPVASQNLLAFSPATITTRFYNYNTATNQYNVEETPGATPFTVGKGYLIRMPNTDLLAGYDAGTVGLKYPGVFTGVPNNGNITFRMVDGGAGKRFNLVGNPYPSPITLSTFVSENASNIEPTLYFWRKTNAVLTTSGSAYCTWNVSGTFVNNGSAFSSLVTPSLVSTLGVIQTGQGFFVEAKSGQTTLTFNNTQRVIDTENQFFRTNRVVESSKIWLNATNAAGNFSQMAVTYFDGATIGVDAFDAKYINDSNYALTSSINDAEYTIQGRPAFDVSDVVALNFKTTVAGNYTIAIDHVEGLFSTGQTVFLKDNLLNTVVDLSAGGYSFASAIGTFNSRFEVVYQNTLAVTNPTFTANSVIAYSANGEIRINSGSTIMELVRVYDLQGRLLVEKKQINASETKLSTTATNQVLLVEITAANGSKITKKIIQ